MAYVAVKGGREAIDASLALLERARIANGKAPRPAELESALSALIDQVMSEGSVYDETAAALALKQAMGSPEEAVFLLRAYRSTLPRKHYSLTVDTAGMRVERRISACFKDVPGGQILGASPDYGHRLLDFALMDEGSPEAARKLADFEAAESLKASALPASPLRKVADYLRAEGLLPRPADDDREPGDVTKKALEFPASRSERLQILSRGQTGAVTALGYASLRGYGILHPTVGELRVGMVEIVVPAAGGECGEDDGYYVGELRITEVESLIPLSVPKPGGKADIRFDIGYGACFGQNETKAIAMSLLDQCLEAGNRRYPTQDEEFVLYHVDSVEATGFISHLKLPHYVTFQAKLDSVRKARKGGDDGRDR
jgi:alpha-D-ribose 1-methylphosphonate 5-triphosphate synthase subunit PhnI